MLSLQFAVLCCKRPRVLYLQVDYFVSISLSSHTIRAVTLDVLFTLIISSLSLTLSPQLVQASNESCWGWVDQFLILSP